MRMSVLSAVAAIALMPTAAWSQTVDEYWTEDPDVERDGDADLEIDERVYVPQGPRVYGWSAAPRPISCGTFKYWTGTHCADARFDPPPTD